jgi:hypothetical protein
MQDHHGWSSGKDDGNAPGGRLAALSEWSSNTRSGTLQYLPEEGRQLLAGWTEDGLRAAERFFEQPQRRQVAVRSLRNSCRQPYAPAATRAKPPRRQEIVHAAQEIPIMNFTHAYRVTRSLLAAAAVATAGWVSAQGADTHSDLPLAPHGTPFTFAVIESHDAEYLGDTPAHVGKDGGLTTRPHVALGDAVYRTVKQQRITVGRITRVVWNRVSGSLEVEFDPEPFQRVAVGDEVWIDLNPEPAPADASASGR